MENLKDFSKHLEGVNKEQLYIKFNEIKSDYLNDKSEKNLNKLKLVKKFIEEYNLNNDDEIKKNIERNIKNNYTPYPQYDNPNFINELSNKQEYYYNKNDFDVNSLQCNNDFEYGNHQIFLKNFIQNKTPYKGILLYHGVGTGKTCSAVTIAENFRDIYGRSGKKGDINKRIIVLVPNSNVESGWRRNIFDVTKNSTGHLRNLKSSFDNTVKYWAIKTSVDFDADYNTNILHNTTTLSKLITNNGTDPSGEHSKAYGVLFGDKDQQITNNGVFKVVGLGTNTTLLSDLLHEDDGIWTDSADYTTSPSQWVYLKRVGETKKLFDKTFLIPVDGRISGVYGSQRILNSKPRSTHKGIDIAAPKGTKIYAPSTGRITLIEEDMFFTGKTVIVDHGMGLISIFAHLNSIYIRPGQFVEKGMEIGEVGMSGRATGPHLHWGVYLENISVDPMALLEFKFTD